MAAWNLNGTAAIAAEQRSESGDETIVWSLDGGRTWRNLIAFDDVKDRRSWAWYHDDLDMIAGGLVGAGNQLYFFYSTGRALHLSGSRPATPPRILGRHDDAQSHRIQIPELSFAAIEQA
jgi:hypothetical protein